MTRGPYYVSRVVLVVPPHYESWARSLSPLRGCNVVLSVEVWDIPASDLPARLSQAAFAGCVCLCFTHGGLNGLQWKRSVRSVVDPILLLKGALTNPNLGRLHLHACDTAIGLASLCEAIGWNQPRRQLVITGWWGTILDESVTEGTLGTQRYIQAGCPMRDSRARFARRRCGVAAGRLVVVTVKTGKVASQHMNGKTKRLLGRECPVRR